VKRFIFAMNSFSIFVCFIYELKEKNTEIIGILCRLPSAVNVMLKLSNVMPRIDALLKTVKQNWAGN